MKRYKFLLLFVILFTTVMSISSNANNLAQEGAFVLDSDKSILRSLAVNKDLIFDHPNAMGFEVYGPKGLHAFLTRAGIQFIDLNAQNAVMDTLNYPTPEQVEAELRDLNKRFPNLTQLIEIGRSNDGRPLLVLKISDNAAVDELEPEFKYISSMHGDEITGRELMVMLAKDILEAYGNDEEITNLVDNTEIYIMASMNPDGSHRRQRGNAKWVDLNRDFPDFSTYDNKDDPAGRQVETQAIMNFQKTRQFALSSNFHGGAEVMNYAWDTIPDRHPFHDLLIEIALDYVQNAPYLKNGGFKNGITNGYAWYEVNNGMQDWSYYWYNDLQFTVELSRSKWPSYSSIPYYYEQNKPALLSQIKYVHMGAGFKIEVPDLHGEVRIFQITDGVQKDLGTYKFRNSEFYKVLPVGEYLFEVTSPKTDLISIQMRVEKPHNKTVSPNYAVISFDQ